MSNRETGESEKDHPGVVARPPLIYLAALAIGIAFEAAWPRGLGASAGGWLLAQLTLGLAGMVAGAVLMRLGIREFRKAGTDFRPTEPTTRIITTGPFRFSRNPLYVSLTLIYLGIALAIDSAWVLAMVVPALIVMRYGVIAREERYLERKFGDTYLSYRNRVRRWI